MSLLRQIQDAATQTSEPISDLLRRCLILASRLDHAPLRHWANLELGGYRPSDELPDYRVIATQSYGHFFGMFGQQLKNAPIPPMSIPQELRFLAEHSDLRQGVGAYEDLILRRGESTAEPRHDWPADVVALVGRDVYENLVCAKAWQVVPRSAIVGLLDTVRNRVLSFSLAIEEENPAAGEVVRGASALPETRLGELFKMHVIEGD